MCVHVLLADSTFLVYRLALIDHFDKQLLPILCCLDFQGCVSNMWLKLTVVGKCQQDSQQVAVVTIKIGILQKHKLVSSRYKARMLLGQCYIAHLTACGLVHECNIAELSL